MQQHYQSLYQQVRNLQFRVNDSIDQPNHPVVAALKSEVQRLEDEVQSEKSPRNIEGRIVGIQHKLEDLRRNGDAVMDSGDSSELHQSFERMRQDVRRMPGF